MPDRILTPGAAVSADAEAICKPGYASTIRPRGALWRRLKDEAYRRYHIKRGNRSILAANGVRYPAYVIDHLIPLEIGGDPTDIRNLWPEPIGEARDKDKIENRLHALVCGHELDVTEAQSMIVRNWKGALPTSTPP